MEGNQNQANTSVQTWETSYVHKKEQEETNVSLTYSSGRETVPDGAPTTEVRGGGTVAPPEDVLRSVRVKVVPTLPRVHHSLLPGAIAAPLQGSARKETFHNRSWTSSSVS